MASLMIQQTQRFVVTPTNRTGVYWLEYQRLHTSHDEALIASYGDSVMVIRQG